LTRRDYIEIVSTYNVMTNQEFDCSKCKVKYPRDKDRQHKHQERKGCFSTYPKPIQRYRGEQGTPMHTATKINYMRCPAQIYSAYWASFINLQINYENGIMPFSGNSLDQPAKIVEAFNLIHNLREETKIKHEQTLSKYGKRS
jgi:hypothetical protein